MTMWKYQGQQRPDFAIQPGPGQESVWDYPRPPAIVRTPRRVEIRAGSTALAQSERALRVLETASPPTWYVPADDVDWKRFVRTEDSSWCEWKGEAAYWALAEAPETVVAWTYEEPLPAFEAIRGHLCAYPARVECFVDSERVLAQSGGFYGGWVTGDIVGPFKGEPGTGGW